MIYPRSSSRKAIAHSGSPSRTIFCDFFGSPRRLRCASTTRDRRIPYPPLVSALIASSTDTSAVISRSSSRPRIWPTVSTVTIVNTPGSNKAPGATSIPLAGPFGSRSGVSYEMRRRVVSANICNHATLPSRVGPSCSSSYSSSGSRAADGSLCNNRLRRYPTRSHRVGWYLPPRIELQERQTGTVRSNSRSSSVMTRPAPTHLRATLTGRT